MKFYTTEETRDVDAGGAMGAGKRQAERLKFLVVRMDGEPIYTAEIGTDREMIAQLIAAAPEMLDALRAITPRTFGHSKPQCSGKLNDLTVCDTCKAIQQARAAISKAEGRA